MARYWGTTLNPEGPTGTVPWPWDGLVAWWRTRRERA